MEPGRLNQPTERSLKVLVLSRKNGQKIHIGDDIIITVVDIQRGKIRLGIEAKADVKILREELIRADEHHSDGGPVG